MSAQLVNEHFNDFPIDYFKVRPIDFESIIQARGFVSATQANEFINNFLENNPVSTIALNEEGFIGEALNDLIDHSQKDTTIINCAVGQGKTTAILNNLKKQYDEAFNNMYNVDIPIEKDQHIVNMLRHISKRILNNEDVTQDFEELKYRIKSVSESLRSNVKNNNIELLKSFDS